MADWSLCDAPALTPLDDLVLTKVPKWLNFFREFSGPDCEPNPWNSTKLAGEGICPI